MKGEEEGEEEGEEDREGSLLVEEDGEEERRECIMGYDHTHAYSPVACHKERE